MKRATAARGKLGLAALLMILAGCVGPSGTAQPQAVVPAAPTGAPATTLAPAPAPAADRLYVSGTDNYGVSRAFVVNAASGAVERTLPGGYISPDWSTLFVVAAVQDQTVIRAYDVATGRVLRETTVAGQYDVPTPAGDPRQSAFSPDGRQLLLLDQPTPAEQQAWNQTGKAPPARILVLDTSLSSPPRKIDLPGNFWFDALGSDGSLYLIEVLDESLGHAPNYQVRRYDLAAERLDDQPVADKREPGPMNGNRIVSAPSSDGVWLYSLYARDTEGPFVHMLNLKDHYAVCVDLPFPATSGDFETALLWSLALSPNQKTLYAVNTAFGQVAAIDTDTFEVRSAKFPKAAAQAPDFLAQLGHWLMPVAEAKRLILGGGAVSPDGRMLYAVDVQGVAAISTADLAVQGRYLTGWPLNSLALSPNGAALYAVSEEKSALLRVGLPLVRDGPAPEQIAAGVRPEAVMRVSAGR